MCVAYNNALNTHEDPYGEPSTLLKDKIQGKTYAMFERTALLSAFYFVEAYLNGIAFDFLYSTKRNLSAKEREILAEWDFQKNRESYQSFRTKILQYPKIILNLQHPPFSETNCQEVKTLVQTGKELRDALVHQSPKPAKIRTMLQLELEKDVTPVVDSAVTFVRKLSHRLGKHGYDISWLYERTQSGPFSDEAFQ